MNTNQTQRSQIDCTKDLLKAVQKTINTSVYLCSNRTVLCVPQCPCIANHTVLCVPIIITFRSTFVLVKIVLYCAYLCFICNMYTKSHCTVRTYVLYVTCTLNRTVLCVPIFICILYLNRTVLCVPIFYL